MEQIYNKLGLNGKAKVENEWQKLRQTGGDYFDGIYQSKQLYNLMQHVHIHGFPRENREIQKKSHNGEIQ